MMKKNLLKLSVIAGLLIAAVFFVVTLVSATPVEYEYASSFAKEHVEEEYGLSQDTLDVDLVNYWEEEDRYAVRVVDTEGENYEIALRLDEENDLAFLLDVTGQFDEFGLAYCH